MNIGVLAVHERPAHRARHIGTQSLSLTELLVILLGLKSTAPAEALLAKSDGSLRRMALSIHQAADLTPAKRNVLAAAFEIGHRFLAEERDMPYPIRSPKDVVAYCGPRMEDLPVEEFHVLILNAQHRLDRDLTITRGILNSSLVHPREVFREVIAESAAAIILVHNHPSGDPTPSNDDRNVTDQLVAAGRLLDIPVHDHIIIGRGRYVSFAEASLL